jgi:hypothetical protein
MCGLAAHAALVCIDALVSDDWTHAGRFAHDAAIRLDAAFHQVRNQKRRADTADFLVERQGEVNRFGKLRTLHLGHQRQRRADEAFHVAGAAAVEFVAAYFGLERVAVPVLSVNRHDVGMARQHDAAVGLAIVRRKGGEQIGPFTAGVVRERAFDAERAQFVAHGFDQAEIRIAAHRIHRYEACDPRQRNGGRSVLRRRG